MDGTGGGGTRSSPRGTSRPKSEEQAGPAAATTTTIRGGPKDAPDGTAIATASDTNSATSGVKEDTGGAPEPLMAGAPGAGEEGSSSGDGRDLVAPPADDEEDEVPLSQLKEYQERHSPRRSGRAVKHKYRDDEYKDEDDEEEMKQFSSDDSEEYEEMDDNEDWTSLSFNRPNSNDSKKTDKYGNPFSSHQCPHCERCFSCSTSLNYHTQNNICKNGTLPPQGKNGGLHTTDPEIEAAVRRGDADVAVDPLGKKKLNDKKERLCIIRGCEKLRRPGKAWMCVRHKKDWAASGMPWPSQAEEVAKVAAAVAAGAAAAGASTTTDSPSSIGGRSKRATAVKAVATLKAAIASDDDIEEDSTDDASTDAASGDEKHLSEEVEEEDDEEVGKASPKEKTGRGYDTSPPEVNAAVKRGDISAVDPAPKFNERGLRCCTIKECIKLSRGTSFAFMCHTHYKDWMASGCVLPDVSSATYKRSAKAIGRNDAKPPAPKLKNVKSSLSSRSRRGSGGRPSRPARSTSADACYIDGCDMPKEVGMETCEEHSPLHPGKRRSRASSDSGDGRGKRKYTKKSKKWSRGWSRSAHEGDEEDEEVQSEVESEQSDENEIEGEESSESEVEAETATETQIRGKRGPNGLWKSLCRVEGCPKYLQAGRDGMCAVHFNAAKVYGVDAVLAEGMEVGASAGRKKHTNEKKPKGSSRESPRKARAKRSEQAVEKQSMPAHEPTPKRKKLEEPTKPLTPARKLEKELGLPKYDDKSNSNTCVVGSCQLGIQIPREYRMCRSHYRELVENEKKGKQEKYARYAALMRPPKSPSKSSPKKKIPKVTAKAKATPSKRKMSTGDADEGAGKAKRRTSTTPEMPAVVDDRMAPDATEEAVAFVSAQVCDIWKALPSDVDLNSLPPIPKSVSFGDTNQDSTPDDKPVADENAEEGEAATKKDDLKSPLTESINVNPKMNYNVIHLAVKARLAAKNYSTALSLCQKALVDWYDQVEKCARFHRSDPPNLTSLDPDVPSLEAVCDSLAGLWCVYAWLLQELVTSNEDAEVFEAKLPPPRPDSSTPSIDRKFLSGAIIPENLFGLSHEHIRWSDVLTALKVATSCHLAGRRAWPWLARARAIVLAAEAAEKAKTTSSSTTPDDTNDQTRASSNLLKSYGDAVSICREGISRVSVLSSAHLAKSRKLLVPTSIQGITLPFFGQDNTRALCTEINHMCDMKQRVEKAMAVQIDNTVDTGAVMNGGTTYGVKSQDAANQLQENNDRPTPPSATSAVRAVEWVCSGCAEHFSNKDGLLSHKKECPNEASGGKGGGGLIDQEKHTANEIFNTFPVSCASMFSEADASDVLDYLVEMFPATNGDIGRKIGRPAKVDTDGDDHNTTSSDHTGLLTNSPVFEGQVGLRCIHCRDIEGTSGVVYPPSISDLPRAMWRLRVSHFERCKHLPDDCRARYEVLRNSVAPESISSKRYWGEAANGLRLQDVSKGIIWPSTTSSGGGNAVRFDDSTGAPN